MLVGSYGRDRWYALRFALTMATPLCVAKITPGCASS